MIVYFLESSFDFGGQQTKILAEAKALTARGHSITVVAPRKSKIIQRAAEESLRYRALEMRNSGSPAAICRLKRWIHEDSVEILHANSAKDAWLAGIAARLPGARPRVLRTRHITNPIKHQISYSWLPDYLVVISQAMKDRFICEHRVDPRKVILLKPAVDFARFETLPERVVARRELGLSPDDFLIGMVAEFRGEKDHGTLVRAFRQVQNLIPNSRLLLVGEEGRKGERVRQQVSDLGLGHKVEFLGFRGDVPLIMRAIDLSVLTSTREPFGQVLLESMAAKTPVVASRVEGPLEIVKHGETGLLFDAGDDQQLTVALVNLYQNRSFANHLVENAWNWVRLNHDFDAAMIRLENIYQMITRDRYSGDPQ